jgi:DNA-binding response OmpR family regulator
VGDQITQRLSELNANAVINETMEKTPDDNKLQRIMVVDDDEDMLKMLYHTLNLEGFDTVIVADSDQALRVLKEVEPDLVVLDSITPGEADCIKTLDQLREHSGVPIIVIDSDYELESLRKVLSHGADDYVRKPFSVRTLTARIKAKLRRCQPVK